MYTMQIFHIFLFTLEKEVVILSPFFNVEELC